MDPMKINVSTVLERNFDVGRIRRVDVDLSFIFKTGDQEPVLAFILENVLTNKECEELILLSEKAGYSIALVHSGNKACVAPGYRDGDRVMIDDRTFVKALESRIKSFLPCKFANRHFLEINERLRFLRYSTGGKFAPHYDGQYIRPNNTARTFITLQIYLNEGFEGGETTFLSFNKEVRVPVTPKAGMILVFQHDLYHEGSLVKSGLKYTIRTDVLYSLRDFNVGVCGTY